VDLDASFRAPRGSHAHARLRCNARGCHGCIRQELAARMKESPGVPGLSNMASTVANEPLVREHERIVGKLNGRHFLGAYHHLERFNPLTNRRGNRHIGGRGRPYSEPNRDQSGGKGKQGGLASELSLQSAQPQHAVAQPV